MEVADFYLLGSAHIVALYRTFISLCIHDDNIQSNERYQRIIIISNLLSKLCKN